MACNTQFWDKEPLNFRKNLRKKPKFYAVPGQLKRQAEYAMSLENIMLNTGTYKDRTFKNQ